MLFTNILIKYLDFLKYCHIIHYLLMSVVSNKMLRDRWLNPIFTKILRQRKMFFNYVRFTTCRNVKTETKIT